MLIFNKFVVLFSSTFKKGCGAFIHVSANDSGDALIVRKLNDDHNHDINKVTFIMLIIHFLGCLECKSTILQVYLLCSSFVVFATDTPVGL